MTGILHIGIKEAKQKINSQIRKEMAIFETSVGAMMMWAVAGAASLLLATVPNNMTTDFPQEQRLICICIAGGIAGGVVSVMMFPKTTLRSTAAKWLVSPITAGIFGPALCQYYNIDKNIWYALAATGAIGLFAWGALFIIIPLGPTIAKVVARKYFPSLFEDEESHRQARDDVSDQERGNIHGGNLPPMQDRQPRKRRP